MSRGPGLEEKNAYNIFRFRKVIFFLVSDKNAMKPKLKQSFVKGKLLIQRQALQVFFF